MEGEPAGPLKKHFFFFMTQRKSGMNSLDMKLKEVPGLSLEYLEVVNLAILMGTARSSPSLSGTEMEHHVVFPFGCASTLQQKARASNWRIPTGRSYTTANRAILRLQHLTTPIPPAVEMPSWAKRAPTSGNQAQSGETHLEGEVQDSTVYRELNLRFAKLGLAPLGRSKLLRSF